MNRSSSSHKFTLEESPSNVTEHSAGVGISSASNGPANNSKKQPLIGRHEVVTVIFRTYIPGERATFAGRTFNGNEDANGKRLPGREGYKTEHRISVQTNKYKNDGKVVVGTPTADIGATREYMSDGSVKSAQGSGKTLEQSATRDSSGRIIINVKGNEKNPLTPETVTPGISYNLKITLNPHPNGRIGAKVTGTHDGFPAYEIILLRPEARQSPTKLYHRLPKGGPGGLFFEDVNVNVEKLVEAPVPMEQQMPKKNKVHGR